MATRAHEAFSAEAVPGPLLPTRPLPARPLSEHERDELTNPARLRRLPHGVATRAQMVAECADFGLTEAARRSGVSRATVAKWRRRYREWGLDGLSDQPRPGRPPVPEDVIRRVLCCTLDEPPGERWTTHTIAEAVEVSQATVSRLRRRYFPRPEPGAGLPAASTAMLTYLDVHPSGCALAYQPVSTAPAGIERSLAARADVVETILVSAVASVTLAQAGLAEAVHPDVKPVAPAPQRERPDSMTVVRRAAERVPAGLAVTVVVNVPLDEAAHRWLARHRGISVQSVTNDGWLALLHPLATAIDPRQLTELRRVQARIRQAHRLGATTFTWSHAEDAAAGLVVPRGDSGPTARDLSEVVSGLCAAVAAGQLQAGESISVRRVARLARIPPGRVAEALAQLADEALIERRAGQYLLPRPAPRDVIETYTARGLLGTALARRMAAERRELPATVDGHLAALRHCDELGLIFEAATLDLDFQDEVARASAMPRIGSMFIRLSMQLRLFTVILGLRYRYPTAEIFADNSRIAAAIRSGDPEAAVAAWRSKIDNAARFMLAHIGQLDASGAAGG